jgi:AcrR family transcriptional regulator
VARGSAEQTREALLGAVIRLMERRSVAGISVKEIAAEAGVNHGLVHRYFGSKDGLVREAMLRTNRRVHEGARPPQLSLWFYELLQSSPEIARILARCCLDGPRDLLPLAAPPPEVLEQCVAALGKALGGLGLQGRLDPYVVNAMGVAALLGWVVFRPLLEAGFGLPEGAEHKGAEVARLLDELMGLAGGDG